MGKRKAYLSDGIRSVFSRWCGLLLFIAVVLYYEIIFHSMNFAMTDGNIIQIIAFAVVSGIIFGCLTGIFRPLINRIIATVLVVFIGVLFTAQYVYHSVFNNYMSLVGTIRFGNQAADNAGTVVSNISEHAPDVILLVVPIVAAVVCIWTFMSFERQVWWISVSCAVGAGVVYITTLFVMWAVDSDVYSPYSVYSEYTSVDLAVEKLGVMESLAIDIRSGIKGRTENKDKINFASMGDADIETLTTETVTRAVETSEYAAAVETATENVSVIDTSPNILDLDFDKINELAGSDAVKSLSDYFSSLTPTRRNEYTGMFEGFNVIWITAEGYTGYALESGLFPTLSKLTNEGFVFNNYYQPLWYGSTLGGEYANLMGSPTKNGAYLSMCRAADNENGMLFSMANTLGRLGYICYGFHDNDYTYYDRNITHPELGYEWIASGNGLEYQTDEYGQDIWPQSDLVMAEETIDRYTDVQPFHLYYLTVSGHVPYGYGAANAMSEKNKDVVADLNYSDTTKAYLASQYEMERMLETIIDTLEKKGLLEKTVIVLAGDHVPYDNMEVVDELAGTEFGDSLDAYRSNIVIWSAAMEKPVKVDKVCSSIDILPTMLNLMGADYDSRLLIGKDILSDSAGLVLFPDRSFITDTYEYNSMTDLITVTAGDEVSDGSFEATQLYVADKFTAADSITETGYYTYIARYLGLNDDK